MVEFTKTTPDIVEGIAVYDVCDPEERQEFRWSVSESDVPDDNVLRLAALLKERSLLDIDRITVSRAVLRELLGAALGKELSEEHFRSMLEELESVQVRMLDDGAETDYFFIHE